MPSPESRKPNFLIFFVDQFPARYFEPGSPCITPNLDKLAEQGVRFSQTFTTSPHCCPARATFMTGLYPSRHGVWNNVNNAAAHTRGLKPGVQFFSQHLKQAGYNLAHSGKWHVSDEQTPADAGWEELTEYQKNVQKSMAGNWRQQTDSTADSNVVRPRGHFLRPGWGDGRVWGQHAEGRDAYKKGSYYVNGVKQAIDAMPRLARGSRPWALCVSTDMDPAAGAPREFLDLYDPSTIELPPTFYDTMEDKPRVYQRMRNQHWGQISLEEVRESIANYMAVCTMQDRMVGDLLAALNATGQADDTLVLFVGDHGDNQFAHGMTDMGIHAFRESYHVPAVMRWPNGIVNPGREVNELVSLADFAPTFIELTGGQPAPRLSSRSLVPFLRDEAPGDWRDAIFHQTNGNEIYFTQRTVRTRKWRYTYNAFDFDELYDLENDPHEMRNLAFPDPAMQPVRFPETPAQGEDYAPWPRLPDPLDSVRREMMERLWRFALEEEDFHIFCAYHPVSMAAYGPGIAVTT